MACYISFRDIDFTPTEDGIRVRVRTDIPSHIYLRLTDHEPHIHKKTSYRRGLALVDDVRFCFVVFDDFEQYESGHTIMHTFWLSNYPYCTTKWLYFWGSSNGEVCVSTSPLFNYHNLNESPIPVPEPMYELNTLDPEFYSLPAGPAWDTFDFSRDVPIGATGVILALKNTDAGVNNRVAMRKPGATYDIYTPMQRGSITWLIVGLNSERKIEYRCQDPGDLSCYILGYTGKDVVFPDNAIDIKPGTDDVYDYFNIRNTWSDALFVLSDLGSEDIWNTYHSIQPSGSIKEIYQGSFHKFPFAGVGADGSIMTKLKQRGHPSTHWRAYAYLKANCTTSLNGIDFGGFTAGAFKDCDFTPISPLARFGFIEYYNPFSPTPVTCRKKFGYFNYQGQSANHNYMITHVDNTQLCQVYCLNTDPTDELVGVAESH